MSERRIVGVDVARALASLIMVQGHAYHAWVADAERATTAYAFTRVLGTLPLPAFLLLAGAALGLRVRAAARRAEPALDVQHALLRRGAQIVLWGYATNVAFGWLDGADDPQTWLRADVLHVIGLSLMALAWLGVRASDDGRASLTRLRAAAFGLLIAPTVLCPWLSQLGTRVPRAVEPFAALFIDVPGYTRMPFVPLVSWLALGALLSTAKSVRTVPRHTPFAQRAGCSPGQLTLLAITALLAVGFGSYATQVTVTSLGGPLTRTHPAVIFNVIELAGRAALVLAAGLALGGIVDDRTGRRLAQIGQSSLWIYVAHLPFCYGRFGRPLQHRLDMWLATGFVLILLASSVVLAEARTRIARHSRARAATAVS